MYWIQTARTTFFCLAFALCAAATLAAQPSGGASDHLRHQHLAMEPGDAASEGLEDDGALACVDGFAGPYPCDRVDLVSHLALSSIGGGNGNDIWGWTDPVTGTEYAIMGRSNGTAFVDLSDPENPVYVGNLPTHTGSSSWRDIKVYADHAFIVSDLNGSHGMQVFHLGELRDVTTPPVTFSAVAHYDQFGSAHNIVINEDSGFAYAVGGNCSGGLHMVNVQDPHNPINAGCFSADGYTHDAQCVTYNGPDTEHVGEEICFNSNEDTLTIVDVTNKSNPVQISRTTYSGRAYTHQGWLTEDHAYFLLDDELDESNFGHNTRTFIWDLSDLEAPFVVGTYDGPVPSIDHNQYVKEGFLYQANYRSGLRILSLDDVANGNLTQVAFFDIYPANDNVSFSGAWSVYPYFDSGVVVVSGIGEGLFVLRPLLCTTPDAPTALTATPGGDHVIDLAWTPSATPGVTYDVYRAVGGCPGSDFVKIAGGVVGSSYSDTTVSGQVEYAYQVTAIDETGLCASGPSNCDSATTTGACIAPPAFGGLESLVDPGTASCSLDLGWSAASPLCGGPATYSVYRDTTPGFAPAPENRVASGVTGLSFTDHSVNGDESYSYVVRATDAGNGVEDANLVELTAQPAGPPTDGTWATGAEVGDPTMISDSSPFGGGGPEHIGWEPSTARQHSGARSFFSTYGNNQCFAMQTPPIELTAGEAPQLAFWTVYDIESGFDGGVVEISTDGGASWGLLALAPGYPGSFNSGADACGYSSGQPSFTGTNLNWTEYAADLSALAGQTIEIRWVFSTDGSVTLEGWYVDDVSISHAQVAGMCAPGNLIFADGFESGDASAWN